MYDVAKATCVIMLIASKKLSKITRLITRLVALKFNKHLSDKFLVRLHGEYNILVKLCGNTT